MELKFDEIANLPKRPIEQLSLHSASEYACAKMLEKYAGWRGMDGVTVQIPVGRAIFDFRIGDVFIEYHPISLRRECLTDAVNRVNSAIHPLPKINKLEVLDAISEELKKQYTKRRGQVLAAHPSYGSMELICVHDMQSFVEKVIYRFATKPCPSLSECTKEFRKLQRRYKKI